MGKIWRGGRELKYFDVSGEVPEDPEVLFYGWECEICSCSQLYSTRLYSESLAYESLIPGYDGSVNPNGSEIKTHPMTLARFYNDPGVQFLFSSAAEGTPRRHFTNDSCGGHVHVSLDPISPDQLERIAKFIFGNPAFTEWISGRERRAFRTWSSLEPGYYSVGPHISRLDAICDFAKNTHKKKPKEQYPQYHSNGAIAVNRDTLEFRLFRGTVVPQEVYKNLEFVDLLVKVADIGEEITPATFRDAAMDLQDDYRNLASFLFIPLPGSHSRNTIDIPIDVVSHYHAKCGELGVSF